MSALFAIVVAICHLNIIDSFDNDSSDTIRVENAVYGPFYDALLFNDIAEILSELDSNGHSPLDALLNSESESDENVDDLLSEYQHFLEKAHKQKKYYLEKNQQKNKVPLYRHDAFVKNKAGFTPKSDDYYPSNIYKSGALKFPRAYYNSPLEFFIPMNPKNHYYNNVQISTDPASKIAKNIQESGLRQMDTYQMRADYSSLPLEFMSGNRNENKKYFTPDPKQLQQALPLLDQPDKSNRDVENTLNIRIKVEIQPPNSLVAAGANHCRNYTQGRAWGTDSNTENVESVPSTLTVPFPYYNFPMPMEIISMKAHKKNKVDGAQYHKITIHKKKKSRPGSVNKKHKKKLISFHDVKLDPRPQPPTFYLESFTSPTSNHFNIKNITEDRSFNVTQKSDKSYVIIIETTTEPIKTNESLAEEVVYLYRNNTGHENATEEIPKIENSIEVDDLKLNSSGVTEKLKKSRKRRDISVNSTVSITTTSTQKPKQKLEELKKVERFSFNDPDLLYWPNTNVSHNITDGKKNITVLILEREHNKAKLNISKESIRLNHKTALEKAIFGEVNWDDIDTVAPVFMSFVGKYIRGVLTFCSPTICHSMTCAQKQCIHRICAPSDRYNNNGHCVGSNSTDSVASMESIMDLPSNLAFEIVEILQDKMPGKLFGKVTLCISPKCITFASAKKSFLKQKCSIKDLNSLGHCQNVKNIKNL